MYTRPGQVVYVKKYMSDMIMHFVLTLGLMNQLCLAANTSKLIRPDNGEEKHGWN